MFKQHNKHLFESCVVLVGLLSFTWHRAAVGALPPPPEAPSTQQKRSESSGSAPTPPGSSTGAGDKPATESIFMFPPVLIGGRISHDIRSDSSEGQKIVQRGLTGSINAKTRTFIWQPWFAQLNGELGLNILKHSTDSSSLGAGLEGSPFSTDFTMGSKNLVTTANLQLNVLPRTKYPFEAHFVKTDNRISGTLSALNGYASQTLGFTQNFASDYGNGMFGWDRNTQSSGTGDSRQDSLRLSLSKALSSEQDLQIGATRTDNRLESTGERAIQNHINAQHRYTPDDELTVDTIANASQVAYRLRQGSTEVDLVQLSSFASWRPEEEPFTVTGGMRLLALANRSAGGFLDDVPGGSASRSRTRDANFNAGIVYELTSALRATASANLNLRDSGGTNSAAASEGLGIHYQPEPINLGKFRYDWSTGATLTNVHGGLEESRHLSLQLAHGLSRTFQLDKGSAITTSLNQSIASVMRSGGGPTQRLTHSGSISWNTNAGDGTLYVSFSASDSRSLGVEKETFQIVNFQVSSSLPVGRFSTLSGNLTVQAVRQEAPTYLLPLDQQGLFAPKPGFTTMATGSLTYQHARAFGIPRLRFLSDLRLNSQELLPTLGGPEDMETASWDNNLDYSVGRTTLRMNTRVAKLAGRNNKSIMFTVSRGLGDF